MTKRDDLEAHESGMLRISEITLSDQKIKIYSGVAIVSVLAHISGSFSEEKTESDFRFTRVWSKFPEGGWQVVAGHSGIVL